jgi:dihydrofolate reductase
LASYFDALAMLGVPWLIAEGPPQRARAVGEGEDVVGGGHAGVHPVDVDVARDVRHEEEREDHAPVPERLPPFQGRIPSKSEIAYARLAAKTPHIVLSTTLKSVAWPTGPTAQIIRDVAELRTLKGQPGKNMYVVGGATLVASLLNEDLIDELRLIVHPIALGKGQALFSGVNKRLSLDLVQAESTESGRVIVTYRT